jgi:HD-GYP domain-containing protein (c-di-GMP phosphodiesterase class II)
MRDLSVRVMDNLPVQHDKPRGMRGNIMATVMQVNKELWLILTVFAIALIVNLVVSSQRLMLSFYTLPTLFSAYFFGRRHATMTAVFSALVVGGVAASNPRLFEPAVTQPFDRWFDMGVWSGFLILTGYAMGTLYETKERNIEELRETYQGILLILQQFISKDKYTQNHSYRVSVYSSKIAACCGLDRDRIEDVRTAALLHDIGKLDISRDILYKAAKLNDNEFEEMKTHVSRGVDFLSPIGGSLRRVLPIILAHHDKFDGSGYYPNAGENIPFEARIISVADAYDAITSDRPYRKASTPFEARDIIVKGAGSSFDPRVVRAFEVAFNRGEMEVPEVMI